MITKKKAKVPTKSNPHRLNIEIEKGKSKKRRLAKVQFSSTVLNTLTAQSFLRPHLGEVDLTEAATVMKEKSDKVISGDLSDLESTLTAQVVSLNAIFTTLAKRSANNMGEYMQASEVYMRLALKAQAQCTRTIEVLAAIKIPPIVYAKQANIAHGHQQINNGINPHAHGENIDPSNELLNEENNATLDSRGAFEAGRANQDLAAVETLNGRKDPSR